MVPDVLADRPCGSCNVCCVALTIDDPALQKAQGYRCKNATPENLCGIYPDRPQTCRGFQCGWRLLKWVYPTMRPDRSGVLIRLHQQGTDKMGIVVTLLTPQALKAEGLAEAVAAAVAAGFPVYLNVPGPPGFTSAQARIDGALGHAVATHDKAGLLKILSDGRRQAKGGSYAPIRLTPPKVPHQVVPREPAGGAGT